ncbi:MAG: hypothetical protein IK990_00695 [Ruminiclostridium sp.]|nr:hypothetical protein [Ruminiclostridium sp.]
MQVEIKRKQEFEVRIEEKLVYAFVVEAVDAEEAVQKLSDRFYDGKLTLEDGERVELLMGVEGGNWIEL